MPLEEHFMYENINYAEVSLGKLRIGGAVHCDYDPEEKVKFLFFTTWEDVYKQMVPRGSDWSSCGVEAAKRRQIIIDCLGINMERIPDMMRLFKTPPDDMRRLFNKRFPSWRCSEKFVAGYSKDYAEDTIKFLNAIYEMVAEQEPGITLLRFDQSVDTVPYTLHGVAWPDSLKCLVFGDHCNPEPEHLQYLPTEFDTLFSGSRALQPCAERIRWVEIDTDDRLLEQYGNAIYGDGVVKQVLQAIGWAPPARSARGVKVKSSCTLRSSATYGGPCTVAPTGPSRCDKL